MTSKHNLEELQQGFRVGRWEVRPLRGEIESDGEVTHLEPRVMEVLLCLASWQGELVARDELLRQVWGERAVTDEPLTRCVAILRGALKDKPKNPEYIQTVPKRGYRLLSSVVIQPRAAETTMEPKNEPRPFASRYIAAVILTAVLAGIGFNWLSDRTSADASAEAFIPAVMPSAQPSVAVLPFINLNDDPAMDFFSDGMTHEIINLLTTIPDLRVTSRTSSFYFRNQELDLPSIAKRLGVASVLEGSVRRYGDRILVNVNLIDVATDKHSNALRFDRPFNDVYAVQQEIATTVAEELRVSLGSVANRPEPTDNLVAYQLYLQGRSESWKRNGESMRKAIGYFEEALALDPSFAEANAELAVTYLALPGYSQRPEDRFSVVGPKAIAAARAASAQNPNLSAPYTIEAFIHGSRHDIVNGRKSMEKALSLAPNDPIFRIWYGMLLASMGDSDGAYRQYLRAHEADPLSGLTIGWVGRGLIGINRIDDAIPYLDASIHLGWPNALRMRAELYIDAGQKDEAAAMFRSWSDSQGVDHDWIQPWIAARSGNGAPDEIVGYLKQLELTHRDFGPTQFAAIGAGDEAIASARRKARAGIPAVLLSLDWHEGSSFVTHPDFADIARELGMVDYWETYGWPARCKATADSLTCS